MHIPLPSYYLETAKSVQYLLRIRAGGWGLAFTNIILHSRPFTIFCRLFFGPLLYPIPPPWLLKHKIKRVKKGKKLHFSEYTGSAEALVKKQVDNSARGGGDGAGLLINNLVYTANLYFLA
jgi:hypothetical protein